MAHGREGDGARWGAVAGGGGRDEAEHPRASAVEPWLVRRYWPGWRLWPWPGDHEWIWADPLTAQYVMRVLLDPDEPLSSQALMTLLAQVDDPAPERRTLVGDVLAQAIGDGRLASPELAAAITSFLRDGDGASTVRVAAALRAAAACSPLHQAAVRRVLVGSLTAWRDRPGRTLCELLGLLDELCAAGRAGVSGPESRAELEKLAAGRSKSAALARAVLARPSGRADWPAEAAVLALAARVERAQRWVRGTASG